MSWELLSQIAQVLGGVTVVVAVVFGIAQLRQHQQQRRDTAAVELMRSLQDGDFTNAFRLVFTLPDDQGAVAIRARGPEYEEAAFVLSIRFELLGLVVHRGSMPSDLVEELVGGAVVVLWRKLRPWTEDLRAEQKHPKLFEWFQWLAEQCETRGRAAEAPAFERFRH